MNESVDKMRVFYCPIEYEPRQRYTRQEMIEVIEPHGELLSFFAQASGYEQCVLGLDFDEYEPSDGTIPVIVMSGEEGKVLLKVHGRRFKRAYRASGPGNDLVVTFTGGSVTGWFKMRWQDTQRVIVT